ncbi:MAG: CHASE2 domain-containing protein, partial [Ignavibacteriaceae bacterium]|nr:CHASE2 domain-containing protein [Ignavibacteriaceae bacterium]
MLKQFLTSFNGLRAHKKLFWFSGALVVSLLSASVSFVTEGVSNLLARPPLEAFSNEIISLALKANDFRDKGTDFPAEKFVIIEMDDASIEKLGRINQWPRAFDAEVIRYISSGNPSLIIPDLLYTESDTLPSYYKEILTFRGIPDPGKVISGLSTDDVLADAIDESGRVILSFYDDDINQYSSAAESELKLLPGIYTDRSSGKYLNKLLNPVLPRPYFLSKALAAGSISMFSGHDGVVRTYPLIQALPENNMTDKDKIRTTANISLLAAVFLMESKPADITFDGRDLAIGKKVNVPVNARAEMTMCFPGMDEGFRKISFYKVLENRMPAEFFENKVVYIGATASGVEDLKTTPVGEKVPGVYIHVAALFNLLNRQFIREIEPGRIIMLNLVITLFLSLLFIKARPITSV